MKRGEIVLSGFADAVPVACGMIAIAAVVPTAFGIGFLAGYLIAFCAFSALLLSFWMHVPRYGFGFGAIYFTTLIMLIVFCSKQIAEGAQTLFYRVMDTLPDSLSRTFDMGALAEKVESFTDPDAGVTLVLMLITALFGFMLAFSLIRSKIVLLSMLIPLPPILLSLYYTDQPPALWTIVLLAVYCGYVLLGNALRKSELPGKGRFFAVLALILPAFLLLIPAVFRPDAFEPVSPEMRQKFLSDRFGELGDTVLTWFGKQTPDTIELDDVENRDVDPEEIFKIWVSRTGTYHLRTHSYGAYRDNAWPEADEYDGEWRSMAALGARQPAAGSHFSVKDSVSAERIVPYAFLQEDMTVDESRVRASGNTAYSITFSKKYGTVPGNVTEEEFRYYSFALEQYTMPDGPERDALLSIAEGAGLLKRGDAYATAMNVAAFVRDSGTYTLTPGKTPGGKDFVLYFLTESRKGYCVHFASATTAILQAMGIPARYTTGYYVAVDSVEAGEWHSVPGTAEHAWAEIYVPGVGWLPVESTPGFSPGDSDDSGGSQPGNPAAPTPAQTAAPTAVPTASPTPLPPTPEPAATPAPDPQRETPAPYEVPAETELPLPTIAPTDAPGALIVNADAEEKPRGTGAWWLLLLIPVVPAIWIGAGILIRRYREALFGGKDAKRAIPEMAHYLKRLERYGYPKDPDADEWAEKAVFSNHSMIQEHRELLKRVHTAQREVCKNAPVRRFLLRWILFVI